MFLIHGLSTLAFIWISEWPCVVWILINYLPLSMANSLLHSSLHYAPLARVKQNILLEEIPFLDKSCLQRLRTCITLPITLSIHPSLENDHSCLASLPSNSTPAAPLSQDQSSQVITCSPGWWLKSFCISCSSLRNSDQVPLVLLLPPVLVITLHCPSLLYKPSCVFIFLFWGATATDRGWSSGSAASATPGWVIHCFLPGSEWPQCLSLEFECPLSLSWGLE